MFSSWKGVGDAIKRGAHIRIGYGMGKERDATEAVGNRNNVQAVKGALGRSIPKSLASFLEMKETGGTHQKILVCYRTFAVNGSFNWLPYTGQKGEGYRDETGTLHRHIDQVTELANIALQKLSSSYRPQTRLHSGLPHLLGERTRRKKRSASGSLSKPCLLEAYLFLDLLAQQMRETPFYITSTGASIVARQTMFISRHGSRFLYTLYVFGEAGLCNGVSPAVRSASASSSNATPRQ